MGYGLGVRVLLTAPDGVEAVVSDAVGPGVRAGSQDEGGRGDDGGELHLEGGVVGS